MIRMQGFLYSAFVRAAATTTKHCKWSLPTDQILFMYIYDWLPAPSIYALAKMAVSVPVTVQVKMHGAFCKFNVGATGTITTKAFPCKEPTPG